MPQPKPFRADLHVHTTYSDGVWPLEKVLQEAKAHDLDAISITDHDTLAAYPKAFEIVPSGLTILPGIEISAHEQGTTVHILAYGFDLTHSGLHEALTDLKQARETRIKAILERLRKRKVDLSYEALKAQFPHTIARPHIAQALVQAGHVKSIPQAFDNYLGDKHMGSLKLKTLSTDEAIDLIHQAHGFAVLAHPHFITHKNKLRQILKHPFDGLEGYYGHLPLSQVQKYLDMADAKGLFVTGGSDFHRPQPYSRLGSSYTPAATFNLLMERHLANH